MSIRIARAGMTALCIAAGCVMASGARGGKADAPRIIEQGRAALERGDLRAIERLAASDRVGVYEAVDQLLSFPGAGDDPLAGALAAAYAALYQDSSLLDRVARFSSYTPSQRAARDEALRIKREAIAVFGEGRLDAARAGFEQALAGFHELGDLREEGRCLSNLGAVAGVAGHGTEALGWLEQAERIVARSGDRAQLAAVRLNTAYVHQDLGDLERAQEGLRAAATIAREIGDRQAEAAALLNLGDLDQSQARIEPARQAWVAALELGRSLGDLEIESAAQLNLGVMFKDLGRAAEARERLEEAMKLARRGRVTRTEINAHAALGQLERKRGDMRAAAQHAEREMELARAMGDERILAGAEISQAGVLADLSRYREAHALLDSAVARVSTLEAPGKMGTALRMRAVAGFYLGRYAQGVQDLQEALRLSADAGFLSQEALAHEALGYMMLVLGDRRASLDHLTQAASLYARAGDDNSRSSALDALGVLWFRAGDTDKARELLREAISIADPEVDPRARTEALLDLAAVEIESSAPGNAGLGATLGEALRICEQMDDAHCTSLASLLQARLALRAGDAAQAQAALARIELASRRSQSDEYLWETHHLRGEIAELAGRSAEAQAHYERAVAAVEKMRDSVKPALWRAAIQEDRLASYHALVRLHLEAGRVATAWDVARRAKARSFADSQRIAVLDAESAALPSGTRASRSADVVPQPMLRSLLGHDEVLLDYHTDGRELILFAVATGGLTSWRLGASAAALDSARHPGRPGAGEAVATESFDAACARLGAQLLEPASALISRARRVLIAPVGPLHGVPFGALPVSGRLLMEGHDVAILPSADALVHRRRRRTTASGLLALGSPATDASLNPLPASVPEIDDAARRYGRPARRAVGAAASESLMRSAAGSYEMVHVAAHGFIDRPSPKRSFIALAPGDGEDGRLEVAEIEQMKLSAQVVVLSGCETGTESGLVGTSPDGDEREGLARAFLGAGASSVIGSLWELDDQVAARVFPQLYPGLSVEGAAGALARVQRAMRAGTLRASDGRALDHPFYWAGLVAYGPGEGVDR